MINFIKNQFKQPTYIYVNFKTINIFIKNWVQITNYKIKKYFEKLLKYNLYNYLILKFN